MKGKFYQYQKHNNGQFSTLYVRLIVTFLFSFVYTLSQGQSTIRDSIDAKLQLYRQQQLTEKLYVHIDKSFYVAGEVVWFKIYAVDGYVHQPLALSKIAYVEVMNGEGAPALQAKIELSDGVGHGSFQLPLSMSTGNYQLRAYTAWMKNFDALYFFHQPLTIVNTFKKPDWQKLEQEQAYDFQLFPEGGQLVQGLESKIAFRLADKNGKGVQCTGAVINQHNDTLHHFETAQFGLGTFVFTPMEGQRYKAIITTQGQQTVFKDFPAIQEKGFVMHVLPGLQDDVNITVTTNTATTNVHLLVHARQVAKAALSQSVVNGKATFTLPKKSLGDGINHITIFNDQQQAICERLYFNEPHNGLSIVASTSKTAYTLREKVNIDLHTMEATGKSISANVSMSVHLLDSLASFSHEDITSYLLLTSDLYGKVENPSYYFTIESAAKHEAIDRLMLVHGWRRFRWDAVMQTTKPSIKYLPELEGQLIFATIKDKATGNPAPAVPVFMAARGATDIGYAISNNNGQLQFPIKKIYGAQDLVFKTNSNKNIYDITLQHPFSEKKALMPLPPFQLLQKRAPQLNLLSLGVQVQHNYYETQLHQFVSPSTDSSSFFGQPDKTYFLDDYTRFTTMEEVMREFIPEVRVRKAIDGFHFNVKNTPYQLYFEDNPLVLLDGIPVTDIDEIMAVNPLTIKKINIVARKYFMGAASFNGIVDYRSYENEIKDKKPDAATLMMAYEGVQLKREFYAPVYELQDAKKSRLPDYRNQLFWAPQIITPADGKQALSFFTSDIPGEYLVIIQGLTANGLPGSTTLKIKVEK